MNPYLPDWGPYAPFYYAGKWASWNYPRFWERNGRRFIIHGKPGSGHQIIIELDDGPPPRKAEEQPYNKRPAWAKRKPKPARPGRGQLSLD